MDQQPEAVVETPKRRFAFRRPSKATLKNGALLIGGFGLGAYVWSRKNKSNCACDTDTTEQSDTDN